jgi:uncharacterized membrane protein YadS
LASAFIIVFLMFWGVNAQQWSLASPTTTTTKHQIPQFCLEIAMAAAELGCTIGHNALQHSQRVSLQHAKNACDWIPTIASRSTMQHRSTFLDVGSLPNEQSSASPGICSHL